jgi:long-subunit fatty acid transport protein
MEKKMNLKVTLSSVLLIFISQISFAGGLDQNTSVGARTISLNGLYFAGSPGLSSIASNPAGLNFLTGQAIELSILDQVVQYNFENTLLGTYKSYNSENYFIGGGFYWNLNENLTIGVAYFPIIDYRADWPFVMIRSTDTSSAILPFNMMNTVEINSISPTISFHFGELCFGLSGNIYSVVHKISFPISNNLWGQNSGLAAYQFDYKLDAWTFGGTLGLMYDFNEQLRVGLSIRSGFNVSLNGEAESEMFSDLDSASTNVNASSEFEIPWKFGLGFLYRINDNTNINLDFAYNLFIVSANNNLIDFEDPIWQSKSQEIDSLYGLSAHSIPLLYNNSFDFGLGIEHSSQGGIVYRAGYRFSQSSIDQSTYSFLFPVVDQHTISIGIGYKDKDLTIDAGLAYTFSSKKVVSNQENEFLFGEYSTDGYIPSLTLRYDF